jgi:hypothetical protein
MPVQLQTHGPLLGVSNRRCDRLLVAEVAASFRIVVQPTNCSKRQKGKVENEDKGARSADRARTVDHSIAVGKCWTASSASRVAPGRMILSRPLTLSKRRLQMGRRSNARQCEESRRLEAPQRECGHRAQRSGHRAVLFPIVEDSAADQPAKPVPIGDCLDATITISASSISDTMSISP